PREDGTLVITTKNDQGRPVSAEVSLGLVDEAVYYIQNDYAGDPRQFYFGTKRPQLIHTQSTFQQKSYAKLVETDGEQLIDEREVDKQKRRQDGYYDVDTVNGLNRDEKMLSDDFSQTGASARGGGGGARNRAYFRLGSANTAVASA